MSRACIGDAVRLSVVTVSEPVSTEPVSTERASTEPAAASRSAVRPTGPAAYPEGRGVTGRGVVALVAVTTLVGGLADLLFSGHRSFLFAIAFMASSGAGAFVVRRRDLPMAMIAPPLVYCLLILIMSLIDRSDLSGSFSTRETYYVGNAFVTGAPSIWIGTAIAAGVGWYRSKRAV